MKYLKLFESFEDIHQICKKYNIRNYTINSDGSIDVDGSVGLHCKGLTKLPLKFRNISGYFFCQDNHLTSLEGSPSSVGDDFYCSNNKLISLKGGPSSIGGGFYCGVNELTTFEGGPSSIGGFFNCRYNQLTTFGDFPSSIGGSFYCASNPINQIWILFEDYSKIELLNDYDIFREVDGKPAIVLNRLNVFLEEIGKPRVRNVKDYINI